MPQLRFDSATPDDRAEIEAVLGETYPALLAADYPSEVLERVLPAIVTARPALLMSGTYFIARDTDGIVVAAGGWTAEPPDGGTPRPGWGHIRHVVTRLERTGAGIGRALMAHVMSDAANKGMKQLECLSTLTAVDFYMACGFTEQEPINVAVGEGVYLASVRMTRDL